MKNNANNQSLYISIYEKLKNDIESGIIRANQRLRSKRALAEDLGVSVVTIQNAYSQLLAEGYIYSKEKSGYFANEIFSLDTEHTTNKFSYTFSPNYTEHNYISLTENKIDSHKFPFSVWSKLMRQVISDNYDNLLNRMPNMGLVELRTAISSYLYNHRGMNVNPDNILIGAGTEYLYSIVIKLLGRDKIYAVEDPGYKRIYQIYRAEGLAVEPISLDNMGLSINSLNNSLIDVIHISPSHHFPTGIVMPIKRRQQLLKWASESDSRYIIEDDYDSEFRFEGKPLPTIQSIDNGSNTIYINTFSKTISPSLRISYMVLSDQLREKYMRELNFYSCTVPSFEQYTLAKFISENYYERHINRMKRHYKLSRDRIINIIKNSRLWDNCSISDDISGLHFTLKLETNKTDLVLKEEAKEKGLLISFLSDYSYEKDEQNQSILIINYSGINTEDMTKAVDILAEII